MMASLFTAMRVTPPGRGSSVASTPIHWTIFAGSVKYAKTVSGRALTRTSCSMTSVSAGIDPTAPPLVVLGGLLEPLQPGREDIAEKAVQVGKAFGADPIQAPGSIPALGHEARFAQDLEMLGDGRLGDLEVRGDIAGAQLVRGQKAQDLPARGLRDRVEDFHDLPKFSKTLYKPWLYVGSLQIPPFLLHDSRGCMDGCTLGEAGPRGLHAPPHPPGGLVSFNRADPAGKRLRVLFA